MSGFLGLWNFDGRPVEHADLARRLGTLSHRGDSCGIEICGAAGFGCRLFRITPEASAEHQPLVDPSSHVTLVFDGRLDNRAELLPLIQDVADVSATSADATFVLAAYRAFGDRLAEHLNGDFAFGIFDPSRRQMLLARDAIGVRPIYYCATQDAFLFASEIKAILADARVPRRPNEAAVADLLLTRFTMGEDRGRTFFHDIRSVPPAHSVLVTPDRIVLRQYWDFDLDRTTRVSSFHDHAAEFRHYFDQAVGRRLRSAGAVAISISGGLDSSSIFCAAEVLRKRASDRYPSIVGCSYGAADGSPSDETMFVHDIERAHAVEIRRFAHLPSGVMSESEDAIWHAEAPFLDAQWNRTRAFFRAVRETGCRLILTGHWGDQVAFDDGYLVDLYRRGAWREAWRHASGYGRWLSVSDPTLFRRRFARSVLRSHLPATLVPILRRARRRLRPRRGPMAWYTDRLWKQASASTVRARTRSRRVRAHARSLWQEVRSDYHVLCMEWNNKIGAMHGLEMAFPFLDRDLIGFLMATPGEIQTWQGVPKALLREALGDVLPPSIARRASKADFTHAVNDGISQDYQKIVAYLRQGDLASRWGYVSKHRLDKHLTTSSTLDVQGPECTASWALTDLFALELWLQRFFATDKGTRENG